MLPDPEAVAMENKYSFSSWENEKKKQNIGISEAIRNAYLVFALTNSLNRL
jgi:hypothetical protein